MFAKTIDDSTKCTLFEPVKNNIEWHQRLNQNKKFDENHILIVGNTGSGKTSLLNNICRKFYEHPKNPYKIFYITEKSTGEWANAYWTFPPKEKYHLDKLRLQKIEPKTYPVNLLHPLFMPTDLHSMKALPEIQFFGFDIRKISEDGFATIIGSSEDKETVRLCLNVQKKIKETDNMYDFLWKIRQSIKADEEHIETSLDKEDLYMGVKPVGDTKTITRIIDGFKEFQRDYCILPSNDENIINMIDILNDQKRVSVLSLYWIHSAKMRFFVYVQLLSEIMAALKTRKIQNPVVLVFEEMKILLPSGKTESLSYEKILIKFLNEMLPQIRTGGKGVTVFATTQNISYTNQTLVSNFSEKLIMQLDQTDRKNLYRSGLFDLNQLKTIGSIGKYHFVSWNEFDRAKYYGDEYYRVYSADIAPFAHAERHTNFLKLWKQHYPTHNYKDFLKDFIKKQNIQLEMQKDRLKEFVKIEREGEKKRKEDSVKQRLDKKMQLSEVQESMAKQAYDMKKENSDMTWKDISKQFNNYGSNRIRRLAVKWAFKTGDEAFVEEWQD